MLTRELIDSAKEAEEAANRGEQGTLYTLTRKITNDTFRKSMPVKTKDWEETTSEADQIERWKHHFEEVLNMDAPVEPVEVEVPEDGDIDTSPPTIKEIVRSIMALRNGKLPGIDGIQAEMLKAVVGGTSVALEGLFQWIWVKVEIPEDWLKGLIIKLPKKGDLKSCENWRGITLLSVPGKLLSRIIINRIREALNATSRVPPGKGVYQPDIHIKEYNRTVH